MSVEWLGARELQVADLTERRVEEFLVARWSEGYSWEFSRRAMVPLLETSPRPLDRSGNLELARSARLPKRTGNVFGLSRGSPASHSIARRSCAAM